MGVSEAQFWNAILTFLSTEQGRSQYPEGSKFKRCKFKTVIPNIKKMLSFSQLTKN